MSSPMDDPLAMLLSEVRHAITYGANDDNLDADVRNEERTGVGFSPQLSRRMAVFLAAESLKEYLNEEPSS